jgi:hypothetical protein
LVVPHGVVRLIPQKAMDRAHRGGLSDLLVAAPPVAVVRPVIEVPISERIGVWRRATLG